MKIVTWQIFERDDELAELQELLTKCLRCEGTLVADRMHLGSRQPASGQADRHVWRVNAITRVVGNDEGAILLIRRSDNGNWAIPGGAIELGESLIDAAIRETSEETGITCGITGLVGIYTDPRHVILYTSDGEGRQEFSIVLTASAVSGRPTPSRESSEVRWVPREDLKNYQMDRSMRMRIDHYLAERDSPYLG